MPFERGGIADKLGNRYEGRWIAKQFLLLLEEKIQSVTIEAIGNSEKGVDIWIQKDGVLQAHQCKARNKSKEYWTIGEFQSRGVLGNIKYQLDRNPSYEFHFISSVGSELFKDVCEYARRSNNDSDNFYNFKILDSGKDVKDIFEKFCQYFSLTDKNRDDQTKAFNYLRRIYINVYPDDNVTWQSLLAQTGYLLIGDAKTNVATLLTYAENNEKFGCPIYQDELRVYLKKLGVHPKRLEHDSRIAPAIEKLQIRFDDSIKHLLINKKILHREETLSVINAFEKGNNIVLFGAAGYGKSGVLFEFTEYLKQKNIPYLPIRLDRLEPENTATQFGKQIGLPDCPAFSINALAAKRESVLILDQLDAIRWTNNNTNNALDVYKEVVDHVLALKQDGCKISVVLSCRTFDLEHDPKIRNWLTESKGNKFGKIEIKGISDDNLKQIVGDSFCNMPKKEKKILSCPQNLSLWIEIRKSGSIPSFNTATALMSGFWKNRRLILEEEAGFTADQINDALSCLVDYFERNAKFAAPKRILESCPKLLQAFCSYGILQEIEGEISFNHQNYLDYLIAYRLLRQIDKMLVVYLFGWAINIINHFSKENS